MATYTVFRSDLLSGTDVAADLVSLRVYKSDEPIEVENGTIVELKGYEDGQREVMKAELAILMNSSMKKVRLPVGIFPAVAICLR